LPRESIMTYDPFLTRFRNRLSALERPNSRRPCKPCGPSPLGAENTESGTLAAASYRILSHGPCSTGWRRHRSWLKWSLGVALPCVLSRSTFLILSRGSGNQGCHGRGPWPSSKAREIRADEIPAGTYQAQLQAYRFRLWRQHGASNCSSSLGVDQQILSQMVDEGARRFAEAERLGLAVTDQESGGGASTSISRIPGEWRLRR